MTELRWLYDTKRDSFHLQSLLEDGRVFDELYDFCIGALEVFYAIFKKSDRFQSLKDEVDRQEVMFHVLRKYNLIDN